MQYKFHAFGHPNMLAAHRITLEFTKDSELTLKGDCIVGVKADFDLEKIKDLIKKTNNKKITITIKASNKKIFDEKIEAEVNPDFNSKKELVIRKTNFVSERTFAISSNKAAFDLNRDLIGFLRDKGNKIVVIIKNK